MKIENIKFKAKSLRDGKWIFGDLMKESYGARIIEHTSKADNWIAVDPSTVCMFTGLKDCKGKEIWEGDIIRNPEFPFEKRTVTWNDVHPSFEPINKDGYENRSFTFLVLSKKWTVVGNKFDKEN